MVPFNNIPYKHMRLISKINLTKRFSEIYKSMGLITRLYGTYCMHATTYFSENICNLNFVQLHTYVPTYCTVKNVGGKKLWRIW